MNYTIKYAENEDLVIDFTKSGNEYTVGVWDKHNHCTVIAERIGKYEYAEAYFLGLCKGHGLEPVEADNSETAFANCD